ncbi:MAG: DNA-protecting protein DprA [Clostridiales bacterium]|nr:DNA-protecting protein DprA [Clostridiales bacterium]
MINYSQDEKALIFLSQFEFMTSKKMQEVCECLEEPSKILSSSCTELECLKPILKTHFNTFIESKENFNENTFFQMLNNRGIKCLTIFSKNYPSKLHKLSNPPYILFYVGNLDLINTQTVAIVGARNPSTYGKLVTEKFSKSLAQNNITIISGLASGVDKISHEVCLEVNGKTIAVLGGGFDQIYPAMNVNLAREVAKKGLIITEYFLNIQPTKYSFPHRNRIIAAFSDAILITEAGKKSGSLYTMEYGTEMGIDTYCVPGSIMSELSYATNDLIKRGAAACVTNPEDILCIFGIKPKENKNQVMQLTIEETLISSFLKEGEKDFEFLQEKTQYSTQTLNINLTSMEIRGIIKKLAGNKYILC